MKVAVTGSSGLIGTALTASLRADGHQVVRLVRRPPRAVITRGDDPPYPPGARPMAETASAGGRADKPPEG